MRLRVGSAEKTAASYNAIPVLNREPVRHLRVRALWASFSAVVQKRSRIIFARADLLILSLTVAVPTVVSRSLDRPYGCR